MKSKYILIALFTILLSSCTTSISEEVIELPEEETIETLEIIEETNDESPTLDTTWGSESALDGSTFTIEEMLIYAIQDEYTAKSEYVMIMDKFDVTKPFSSIYKSEDTHISLLVPLFETYQIDIPEDSSDEHLFEVTTLKESFEIGVIAEINNIAMYDLFLTMELPEDIEEVFIRLRDASMNHLAAFEKNLEKYS